MTDLAVEAHGLVKRFKDTTAVAGVDLAVRTGGVYGLLGPNGAGKTTTVRILATLTRPDAGTARVLGHDVVRDAGTVRTLVGLTGQYASVDEDLTGRENLLLLARLYGCSRAVARERADQLLEAFDLAEAAVRPVRTFSGGMRRRVDLAASMVAGPRMLFLDEPTTGLDPRSRSRVWELVRLLVAEGATVLLTTQYLEEADQLADRIAVVDRGRVVAEGTPGALKSRVGSGTVHLRLVDREQGERAARIAGQVLGVPVTRAPDGATLTARIAEIRHAAPLLPALVLAGVEVSGMSLGQPSLDEVFLALTGHSAGDGAQAREEVA